MATGFYSDPWGNWNTSTTSYTASTNTAWTTWTSIGTITADWVVTGTFHAGVETAEDRAERERRNAEYAQQAADREAEREAIRARAEETLALLLTPEQMADWRRTDSFRLITQAGREYRIRRGIAGNVKLIEQGQEVESLCAHPNGVPREDVVIAQVLALRTDEESFRATANIHRYAA